MKILYNLVILLIRFLVRVATLFNERAKKFVSGRRNLFKELSKAFAGNTSPVIWIHCASLGEFEQGRPVLEQVKKEFPTYKILLTFFSPSGYTIRKDYPLADYVTYMPWDTKQKAIRFIEICKPALAIFVKYEFWFHFTSQLKKRNIPLLSVSAIFRENQVFFKSYGKFFRNILTNFTWIFVQNSNSIRLLNTIGITNVSQAGDTRFDRVFQMVSQNTELPIAKNFKGDDKVMVVGSCWKEDLDVLIPFINEHSTTLKFIIAPHEIDESLISELEKSVISKTIRYSRATDSLENYQVLIVDNVGILGKLYKYGEFAFVGGAFGKGLHNILEAACYGIPIFFGNRSYEKFQEAVDLINRGGAFEVNDFSDLDNKYKAVMVPQSFLLACEVTRNYVEENLGATERIIQYCRKFLAVS